MAKNTMYKIKNRSSGRVFYSVVYNGNKINQALNPGEVKFVPEEELRQLSYQQGGPELIYNYLMIGDKITDFLNIKPEPEYYMGEKEVKELLAGTNNLDEFLDCLDFAPTGVIDLIKKYAVEDRLNDYNKRKAIKDRLGFDVDAAIKNDEASKEGETKPAAAPTRRVTKQEGPKEETSVRRTTPKYNIVNKQE